MSTTDLNGEISKSENLNSKSETNSCCCRHFHKEVISMKREKHELELTKIAQEMQQNLVKHKQTMAILTLKEMTLRKQLDSKTNLNVQSESIGPEVHQDSINQNKKEELLVDLNKKTSEEKFSEHSSHNMQDDLTIDAETSFKNLV